MLTTLRTGSLTLSSIQYSFDANNFLTIKLTASAAHKIYGEAKITLANVKVYNITKEDKTLSNDYLNGTFTFVRTGSTTLEYKEQILSGIPKSDSLITLLNDGSSITATIANSYVDIEKGEYNFLLLDTSDSEFSTSRIGINYKDLANTGIAGLKAEYNEIGDTDYLSINDLDLSFDYPVRVSIVSDDSGTTNIPLKITSNHGSR